MANTIENFREYKTFTEAYEVVKTIELVLEIKEYKIEILKTYSTDARPYKARFYILDDIKSELAYNEENPLQTIRIWREISGLFSDIEEETIDFAIEESLVTLNELKKPKE